MNNVLKSILNPALVPLLFMCERSSFCQTAASLGMLLLLLCVHQWNSVKSVEGSVCHVNLV